MSQVFCPTADFELGSCKHPVGQKTRLDRGLRGLDLGTPVVDGEHRLSCLLLLPKPQVRIHKEVEVPPRPPAEDTDSDAAAEPAEQEELLDSGAAAEQGDWL